MDRFTKFILDSNHILTKNLNLAMSYDVKEKMKEKCTLLNIKIEDSNLEDLDTLKKRFRHDSKDIRFNDTWYPPERYRVYL